MKRSIYIAVPTLDRKVSADLTHFLCAAEAANFDPDNPWAFSRAFFVGYKPVDHMRNVIFRDFLASDCERLWMIDADILPPLPPTIGFGLLDVESDITAGVIPGMKAGIDGGLVLKVLAFDQDSAGVLSSIDPSTHPPQVDAAGAGCMVIHRRVLEDPRMRYGEDMPESLRPADWMPSIYRVQHEPWGAIKMTGDVDFCLRAKECGYTVTIWPDAIFGQTERLDLRDVAAYGARCAASAMGEQHERTAN